MSETENNGMSFSISNIIHVALECVVIAGVSFWLHKKISSLEEEVNKFKTIIIEQNKHINNLYGILEQNNLIPKQQHVHKKKPKKVKIVEPEYSDDSNISEPNISDEEQDQPDENTNQPTSLKKKS